MPMRTDPFLDLDRLTSQVLGTAARPASMALDAYRDDDEFVVLVDLPGIDPDHIDLTVERNMLAIEAERDRGPASGHNCLISERPAGSFSRQLFLGDALDADRLDASYQDGVLQLRIPVAERAKARRVPIRTEARPPVIDVTSRSPEGGDDEEAARSADERQLSGSAAQA